MDDLGSLSALPPMTSAVRQSNDSGRFQWLKPWQWISGLGWRGGKNRATVELTAQVRGSGLEHCSSVQVRKLMPALLEFPYQGLDRGPAVKHSAVSP